MVNRRFERAILVIARRLGLREKCRMLDNALLGLHKPYLRGSGKLR
jgi:hypothetical protein